MLIVTLALLAGHGSNPGDLAIAQPVPAFDMAIGKYLAVERNFSPNVPPEAYSNTDGTVYAWVQNGDPGAEYGSGEAYRDDDLGSLYGIVGYFG